MTSTPARREWAVVATMTVVGAVLRFWGPGRLGLNHFDEGIYALAGLWSVSPRGLAGISPELVAYAPPLFPILVGVSYLFLGVSDVSAILVAQVCGVLTIPAVAWVGRRTFGPGAGAAAAALCAVSGPHIAFSRMALVDSTFLLCWVLALGLGGWFLERPGVLRAIVFGGMVGLAQNAKYNGYLAGGIVALAAVWGLVVPTGASRAGALKAIGFGMIAGLVALAVYWPWYRFVEAQPGGYAGLMAHHRSYLSGVSAWPEHWRLQMGEQVALAGRITDGLTWGAIAWSLAWLGGWIGAGWPNEVTRTRWTGARVRIGLLAGLTIVGCAPNAPWWASLLMLPWVLLDRRPAARVAGITWLVMAGLTPFYHPYARLWLPLHAAGWVVLAGVIVRAGPGVVPSQAGEDRTSEGRRGRAWFAALAVAASLALFADLGQEPRARTRSQPTEPTDELRLACGALSAQIGGIKMTPAPRRVFVVARPAVIFYLGQSLPLTIMRKSRALDVAASLEAGDLAVADTAIGDGNPEEMFALRLYMTGPVRGGLAWFGVIPAISPIPTALDLDPGSPFATLPHPAATMLDLFRKYPQ